MHPFLILQFLIDGGYGVASGRFLTQQGHYRGARCLSGKTSGKIIASSMGDLHGHRRRLTLMMLAAAPQGPRRRAITWGTTEPPAAMTGGSA